MISVVVPTHNRAGLIGETIQSVLDQSCPDWELIIVDDHSTDTTEQAVADYARRDSRIRSLRRSQAAKGPAPCRNEGVAAATGEFLLFLDSDDLLAPHCLKQRVDYMKQHPELDFAVFPMVRFYQVPGDSDRVINRYLDTPGDSYLKMLLRGDWPWTVTSPIWRRHAFVSTGGFDNDMQVLEDPDLHTRAIFAGLTFEVVENARADCYYRAAPEGAPGPKPARQLAAARGMQRYFTKTARLIKCKQDIPRDDRKQFQAELKTMLKTGIASSLTAKASRRPWPYLCLSWNALWHGYIGLLTFLLLGISFIGRGIRLDHVKGAGIYRISRKALNRI
jgi:glycosyltransferase involved in cell wall biosynthesis